MLTATCSPTLPITHDAYTMGNAVTIMHDWTAANLQEQMPLRLVLGNKATATLRPRLFVACVLDSECVQHYAVERGQ